MLCVVGVGGRGMGRTAASIVRSALVVSVSGVGFDVHYRLLYCVLFVSWDGATEAARPTVRSPSCVSVCGAVVAERSVLKVAVVMVGLRLSVETPSSSLLWSESQLLAAVPAGAGAADRYSTPRPPGAACYMQFCTRVFSFLLFFFVLQWMASRRERVKMAEHSEREASSSLIDGRRRCDGVAICCCGVVPSSALMAGVVPW